MCALCNIGSLALAQNGEAKREKHKLTKRGAARRVEAIAFKVSPSASLCFCLEGERWEVITARIFAITVCVFVCLLLSASAPFSGRTGNYVAVFSVSFSLLCNGNWNCLLPFWSSSRAEPLRSPVVPVYSVDTVRGEHHRSKSKQKGTQHTQRRHKEKRPEHLSNSEEQGKNRGKKKVNRRKENGMEAKPTKRIEEP